MRTRRAVALVAAVAAGWPVLPQAAATVADGSTDHRCGFEPAAARPHAPPVVQVADPRIGVGVYVHVIRSNSTGGVGHRRILRQLGVLDDAYAGRQSRRAADTGFRFRLVTATVTDNRAWQHMTEGSRAETRAKRALHRGDAGDLNLYIVSTEPGVLGWSSKPQEYAARPFMDGVVIGRRTLPGGVRGPYSLGDAGVHESGHWLGLLHTFRGGCHGDGDLVPDTPAEGRASYTCPVGRDTCLAPGRDPIHNFMDYSFDRCMNRFTRGQSTRMTHMWMTYRAPRL